MSPISSQWRRWRASVDLDEYEHRWERLAARGQAIHGEADFIASMELAIPARTDRPISLLDAGCGMGRVGIELARRGMEVVGVDLDADLLERARRIGPDTTWHHADLATVQLGRRFDIVALAGNVLPFVEPADRPQVIGNSAAHLRPGGYLVAGFSVPFHDGRQDWPRAEDHDAWCAAAGLVLEQTWSSWDRLAAASGDDYRVVVHRRPT